MMNLCVDVQSASRCPAIPSFSQFEKWVESTLRGRKAEAELSIRIVDEAESRELNHRYRRKDNPTNVLSFPFEIPSGIPAEEVSSLLGDLIICAPVVEQEATEQKKESEHHWAHIVVHGTLHLIGYDHINDTDAEKMEELERNILATMDIPDPYQQDDEVN